MIVILLFINFYKLSYDSKFNLERYKIDKEQLSVKYPYEKINN